MRKFVHANVALFKNNMGDGKTSGNRTNKDIEISAVRSTIFSCAKTIPKIHVSSQLYVGPGQSLAMIVVET